LGVIIDSNVIVSFLIKSDKTEHAKVLLEKVDEPLTLMSIIEEACYVGLSLIYNARGWKLRETIEEEGLNDVAVSFLKNLSLSIKDFGIRILEPPKDTNLLIEMIKEYKLLPNDALIAATCKYYGIKKNCYF